MSWNPFGIIGRKARLRSRPPLDANGSEQELVEQNFRWNFSVNMIDTVFFLFGVSLISSSTIVPLFISKLTDSSFAIGLAAMVAQGGWFLPQILTTRWVERQPLKKPIAVKVGFFAERLPVLLLAGAALLAIYSPQLALIAFLLAYTWHNVGGGVVGTAWQDMIARIIPVGRRGRFWGLSTTLGQVASVGGASLAAWLLAAFSFPYNFVAIWLPAALLILLSWVSLSLTREPPPPEQAPLPPQNSVFRNLADIVKNDPLFRRFLSARMLHTLGNMALGFVAVAAIKRWSLPDSTIGVYAVAQMVGQGVATLGLGFLADRLGHKLSLEIGAAFSAVAYVLAWLAPSPGWMMAVFVLLGVGTGASLVSGILIVMEFGPVERRPSYMGIANTAVGLTSMAGPLLAAGLVGFSYGLVFALSATMNLIALAAFRFTVREPRWTEETPATPTAASLTE